MKAYTDYPFEILEDTPGAIAPIREIEILSYDRSKYCMIRVEGHYEEIKAGYIYLQPGRAGEVPSIDQSLLKLLPRSI